MKWHEEVGRTPGSVRAKHAECHCFMPFSVREFQKGQVNGFCSWAMVDHVVHI
jgi:hypothetical protein